MDFEGDEAKRQANILKHGIDFVDAIGIFASRSTKAEDLRRAYGERGSSSPVKWARMSFASFVRGAVSIAV